MTVHVHIALYSTDHVLRYQLYVNRVSHTVGVYTICLRHHGLMHLVDHKMLVCYFYSSTLSNFPQLPIPYIGAIMLASFLPENH